MGSVGVAELNQRNDLILALNSGSSSLKFGVYYHGSER